jgi:Big-like domain-containing protein
MTGRRIALHHAARVLASTTVGVVVVGLLLGPASASPFGGPVHTTSRTLRSTAQTSVGTPPSVTVAFPSVGVSVTGTIFVWGTASDDVGVWKVRVRVDDASYRRADGTDAWGLFLDTTRFADGPHVLTARALDFDGNVTNVSVAFVVSNTAPSPSPSPLVSPSPSPSPSPLVSPSPSPSPSPLVSPSPSPSSSPSPLVSPSPSSSPSPLVSPSPSPQPLVSPSIFPTPSPTGSAGLAKTVWGIYTDTRDGLDRQQMISYLEGLIGRDFAGERIYTNMTLDLPMTTDDQVQSQQMLDYHNVNSWWVDGAGNKICYPWSDIAAGAYDGWWITQALSLKAWGYPVYLSFTHEPSVNSVNHPQCGTPAEYVSAYNHIVQLFQTVGVPNVRWVWTLTSSTFNGANGGPLAWQPAAYDIVGVDGYNHASKWRSPTDIFQSAEDFARSVHKPLLVGEIGCDELSGDPGAKATWLTDAAALFKSYGDVIAVLWTNTGNGGDYWLDSSPESITAFTAAGHDPAFN